MSNYYINPNDPDSLTHFGIPGQKHGFRRFQYEDGSLTPAGRERYGVGDGRKHASLADSIHKYRVKKKRSKALEKARKAKAKNAKAKQKQAEAEEQRQKNLKKNFQSDHARQVFNNMDNMTDQELKTAQNRLDTEQKIQKMAIDEMNAERAANPSKYERAADFINKAVKISGDVYTVANNLYKAKVQIDNLDPAKRNKDKNNNKNNNNGNNNQNNQQNQNSNNGNNQKKKLTAGEMALQAYHDHKKSVAANQQLAREKAADEAAANKRKAEADRKAQIDAHNKMMADNQAKLNATEQMIRDNKAARGTAKAYDNWYNSNYTSSSIPQQDFTTSLTEAFDLNKINHGKDILVAMGLD